MKSQPLISVIIPIYNAERHISECIDSVLKQTYKKLEILLINDGSIDKSFEICEKFATIDNRIKLINQSNKGVSETRNKGLEICSGDYVSFVDSDDYLSLNAYELGVRNILNFNSPDLLIFGFTKISPDGKVLSKVIPKFNNIENVQKQKVSLAESLQIGTGLTVWDKLIKTDLIIKNKIKFINLKNGEDINFVFNLFSHTNFLVFIEEAIYTYRLSMGGPIKRLDENLVYSHILNFKVIHHFFLGNQEDNFVRKYVKFIFLNWFVIVIPMYYSRFILVNLNSSITNLRRIYKEKELMYFFTTIKKSNLSFKEKILIFIFQFKSPYLLIICGYLFKQIRNTLKVVH
jgi:glycosyltransferase involved in cell wall biosynthesis